MSGHIGILGSIFDPVHNGHLAIAHWPVNFWSAETFLYSIRSPPHKDSEPLLLNRLAMLRLALKNEPGAEIREEELHQQLLLYNRYSS